MSRMSIMMVHDGREWYDGEVKNFEAWGEFSKKHFRAYAYKIYYKKMKEKNKRITMKKVEQMCNIDNIFTAKEAVKLGLADRLI